ncbi:class I SAM-dependent methyltransferase [Dissulfurimicrobium hydrothermale]|uniref:class I SAM-dependent methyltransferase n=1 Tax=Dissulfurimicrobium hydrothermale TaxID=1750598 RepID=UPI001ED9E323|nr:class I SAM-dependent methyltransferase [Dissulfurimicrobium hydrothermale]UKL12902.1 class I SAM-dependent methyltransferase [Dissulfurimicrobium hydrothermale]
MEPYTVLVQAGPEEILYASSPEDLNLAQLRKWPHINQILIMLPELEGVDKAVEKLNTWGFQSFVGDPYNVCRRTCAAQQCVGGEKFAVRVLAIWKHLDLSYIDRMVHCIRQNKCDAVLAPRDFDVTFAADVSTLSALEKIGSLSGDSQEAMRAKFNPWGYMDMHPDEFSLEYLEPAPVYIAAQREELLATRRCHPENEFFGRDYAGSRYHFLASMIPPGLRILDIACGAGTGSHLLSQKAEFVLGVDYLEAYVNKARSRFSENDRLAFMVGDGQTFDFEGRKAWFDMVISLHTLEHVPNDRLMLANLFRNLKPGGVLVAEVPLLMPRPLGVPINPYHLREYNHRDFLDMLRAAGFEIERIWGVCRGFYGTVEHARDAIHVHTRKPIS